MSKASICQVMVRSSNLTQSFQKFASTKKNVDHLKRLKNFEQKLVLNQIQLSDALGMFLLMIIFLTLTLNDPGFLSKLNYT